MPSSRLERGPARVEEPKTTMSPHTERILHYQDRLNIDRDLKTPVVGTLFADFADATTRTHATMILTDLTEQARKSLGPSITEPDEYGEWSVRLVQSRVDLAPMNASALWLALQEAQPEHNGLVPGDPHRPQFYVLPYLEYNPEDTDRQTFGLRLNMIRVHASQKEALDGLFSRSR